MIGNPLFSKLPARFQWTVHNILGHPLSEIFLQLGFSELSDQIHDRTMPEHKPDEVK